MSHQAAHIDAILDSCLADLKAGRATVEDCLARHAEHAAQLEPLLRVAGQLQAQPQSALSEAARQRIEARVQDHVSQLPRQRPAARPARAPLAGVLRWAFTVALTVMVMSIATGGAIRASGSMPGEPLYSLKTFSEQVEAWFTPPQQLPEMHLKFAANRLDEVMAQGHIGIVDDLAIIRMETEMRYAMEVLVTLPAEQQEPVIQDMLRLTNRQSVVLSSLLNYTSPLSQAGLEWGIDTAHRRTAQLEAMLK